VFQLKNADSLDVSFLLEDIFKPKDDDQQGDGFFRYIFFGGANPGQKAPKMTAVSDDRTNSVIVTAPSEMLKAIEDVIQKLDTNPVSEENLFIYRLRNAQAYNLEFVLNSLFGNISQPGQNQQQDENGEQRNQQFGNTATTPGAATAAAAAATPAAAASTTTVTTTTSSSFRPGSRGRRGELTNKVFVVADTDKNALIVTTAASTSSRSARSSTSWTARCRRC
jgi:type II secretory pathway component GspD/PulD (secretin)